MGIKNSTKQRYTMNKSNEDEQQCIQALLGLKDDSNPVTTTATNNAVKSVQLVESLPRPKLPITITLPCSKHRFHSASGFFLKDLYLCDDTHKCNFTFTIDSFKQMAIRMTWLHSQESLDFHKTYFEDKSAHLISVGKGERQQYIRRVCEAIRQFVQTGDFTEVVTVLNQTEKLYPVARNLLPPVFKMLEDVGNDVDAKLRCAGLYLLQVVDFDFLGYARYFDTIRIDLARKVLKWQTPIHTESRKPRNDAVVKEPVTPKPDAAVPEKVAAVAAVVAEPVVTVAAVAPVTVQPIVSVPEPDAEPIAKYTCGTPKNTELGTITPEQQLAIIKWIIFGHSSTYSDYQVSKTHADAYIVHVRLPNGTKPDKSCPGCALYSRGIHLGLLSRIFAERMLTKPDEAKYMEYRGHYICSHRGSEPCKCTKIVDGVNCTSLQIRIKHIANCSAEGCYCNALSPDIRKFIAEFYHSKPVAVEAAPVSTTTVVTPATTSAPNVVPPMLSMKPRSVVTKRSWAETFPQSESSDLYHSLAESVKRYKEKPEVIALDDCEINDESGLGLKPWEHLKRDEQVAVFVAYYSLASRCDGCKNSNCVCKIIHRETQALCDLIKVQIQKKEIIESNRYNDLAVGLTAYFLRPEPLTADLRRLTDRVNMMISSTLPLLKELKQA
jgi:hypothetical protein